MHITGTLVQHGRSRRFGAGRCVREGRAIALS